MLFEFAQIFGAKHSVISIVLKDLRYVFGIVVRDFTNFLFQVLQVHIFAWSKLLLQMLSQTEVSWLSGASAIALIL